VHALIELSPAVLNVNELRKSSFRKARQRTEERGWTGEDTQAIAAAATAAA